MNLCFLKKKETKNNKQNNNKKGKNPNKPRTSKHNIPVEKKINEYR